jgi:hypothetical protein
MDGDEHVKKQIPSGVTCGTGDLLGVAAVK